MTCERRAAWRTLSCWVAALALVLAASSCGSPTTPTSPFAGTWLGTFTDARAGTGDFSLVIEQKGSDLSGSWAATFPDATFDAQGRLTMVQNESIFTLFLSCSPSGSATMFGRMNGSSMSGTFSADFCRALTGGPYNLTKQ